MKTSLKLTALATFATLLGYGLGKGVESTLNKNINTYGNSLRTEPIRMGSPISRFIEPSLVPVGIGNAVDSIGNKISENIYEQIKLSNEVSK